MNDYYLNFASCAGRSIHTSGTEVTRKCEDVREKVKRYLNAEDMREIIFTKNTTESIKVSAPLRSHPLFIKHYAKLVKHGIFCKVGESLLHIPFCDRLTIVTYDGLNPLLGHFNPLSSQALEKGDLKSSGNYNMLSASTTANGGGLNIRQECAM